MTCRSYLRPAWLVLATTLMALSTAALSQTDVLDRTNIRFCADVPNAQANWLEIKVEPAASGAYTGPDGSTVDVTISGKTVDWEFDGVKSEGVDVFVNKAGNSSRVFDYRPGEETADSDTAPNGASHLVFCYDPDPDAIITIEADGANRVGDAHTFTATVMVDEERDGSYQPFEGADVDFSIGSGPGILDPVSCTTDANGECDTELSSNDTGTTVVNATAEILVLGATLVRTTDGSTTAAGGTNSGPATKIWVDARLGLDPPQDANQVGDVHEVTATLEFDYGDGSGFVAAPDGETIVFATDFGTLAPDTCDTSGGTCTVELTSDATGLSTIGATWTGDIAVAGFTVAANAASDDVVKRWVNARIDLTPQQDDNLVGTPHPLLARLQFDYGDGSGFVDAPAGEAVDLAVLSGPGSLDPTSCTTDGAGECSVELVNPDTEGTTVVRASWSGSIATAEGDASVSAATGTAPSSNDANKDWVLGSIEITKNIEFGPFTTEAEVCFTLAMDGTLQTTSDNPQCYTFTDPTTSHVFRWEGLVAGTYSLSETVDAPYVAIADITGIEVDDGTRNVTLPDVENPLPLGSLLIEKLIDGQLYSGSDIDFAFDVQPCGADSSCSSPGAPISASIPPNPATVADLAEGYYLVTEVDVPDGYTVETNPQIEQVFAGDVSGPLTVTFNNIPVGAEGCTPGYWKNHYEAWEGYSPSERFFSDVFTGITDLQGLDPDLTLGDALDLNGGSFFKLARHGTAALLNEAHSEVSYSTSGVIGQVEDAFNSGQAEPLATDLDGFNNLKSNICN